MRFFVIGLLLFLSTPLFIPAYLLWSSRRNRQIAKRDTKVQRARIEAMSQVILNKPGMKVRLIRQHGLKAHGFFEEWGGTVFQVIQKRDGGYDVDLEPLGYPRKRGWMYGEEVEEILSS